MHSQLLATSVRTVALGLVLTTACGSPPPPAAPAPAEPAAIAVEDVHSHARPQEVAVRHLAMDLTVDFEQRRLSGRASLTVENKGGASQLVLDARDLEIRGVTLDGGQPTLFELGPARPSQGQALQIDLRPDTRVVHVDYATSPQAAALQWLSPAQTAGGQQPFLFTQSQSILARTWVPCQDTPQVRMTYEATVRVPPQLMAVMSASNPTERAADGVYHFRMEQPVPSYLLALAVGDLAFRAMSPRTGVYAEPSVVDAAAWELGDTEKMIEVAEQLYGPYRWERYDMLILPPSFPFGGMENPRLTFFTPTFLAGDRSLTSLVAHELAHSWSGNLVTNATWNDFWLNEGFTTYFERRIMEALYGREYEEMLALLGRQDLDDEIAQLGATSPDTHLRLTLGPDRDPDDATNDVAYEKGYFFLRLLEETVGRERFDPFLRTYFERFAFRSMDTTHFLAYLREQLLAGQGDLEQKLRIAEWVDGPGVPDNAPVVHSEAFTKVEGQVAAWAGGTPAAKLVTDGWNTHQWLHFLRRLPEPLSSAQMADLDGAFRLTASGNSEILNAWLVRVIANRYQPGYAALEHFLTSMGRRKFLLPLYRELAKSEDGLAMARRIYARARPTYHSVSVNTIDEVLAWEGQPAS